MTIRIMVEALLDQRQIGREADKLGDTFDKAGAEASSRFGDSFDKGIGEASPRIQRSFHGIENAMEKVTERKKEYDRAMESGSEDQQEAATNRLSTAIRALDDAYRSSASAMQAYYRDTDREAERSAKSRMSAANAHRKQIEDDAETARKAAEKLANSAMGITDQLADMGRTAGMAFRGTAMLGAPIILYDVMGAVGALAGALGPLTAGLGAAAVGMGTFSLATNGFSDAISNMGDTEKFVESIRSLSPEAQQAAITLRNLMPVFTELQQATQNAFFAGSGPKLDEFLGKMLPTVRETTTGVASAFNEMFTSIASELQTPGTFQSLDTFAQNTVNAFRELAPAAAPFAAALTDIMSVGSSFLPGLASEIATLAEEFGNFIREAQQSGDLSEWMNRGVTAARELVGVIDDVAKMFNAAGDQGAGFVSDMVTGIELVSSTVRILSGDLSALGDMMPALGDVMLKPFELIRDIINTSTNSINYLIRGMNNIPGVDIPEIPELNPLKDVAQGRDMFGGPQWRQGGAEANGGNGNWGNGTQNFPGGGRPPGEAGSGAGGGGVGSGSWRVAPDGSLLPPSNGTQVGVGSRIAGTGTWQSPFAPGQGGINGSGGSGRGKKPNGQEWSAPEDQWSLGSVPIGSFPGVEGPGGMPGALPGTPGGPPIQGPVDPERLWDAQSRQQSAGFRVEETRQRYLELANDNTTSETDLLKAKHDVAESERDFISAQMKLAEVAKGKFKDMSKGMNDIGVALDQDFGLSEGLPGLAKNLTTFLLNLAAAPSMMKLQGITDAAKAQGQPDGGFGLLGMLGAQNMMAGKSPLFGNPLSNSTNGGSTGPSMYSSASASAVPGESARDFAHRAMMPYWQSQGLEVGDHAADSHGEHQNGALDIMVPNMAEGNKVLQQVLSDPNVYGAIFNQQSYGYGHGAVGTPMEDRGSATANHQDHVHALYKPGDPRNINPGGTAMGSPGSTASFTGGGGIPLPLPVTIVGGMPGGAPIGTPASGQGSGPVPGPVGGDGAAGGLNWDALAAKESSGKWDINTGNGFYGGLQFDDSTWKQYGGDQIAPRADLASKEDQIAIAQKAFTARGGGSSLWPANYGQLTALPAPGSLPGGGGGGPGMGMPQGMGFGTPLRPNFGGPVAPNIGPGPLQVGPPGVPGTGGPGQIGPFPVPPGTMPPGNLGFGGVGGMAGTPATPGGAPPTGGPPAGQYGGVTPGVNMGGTGGIGVSGGLMDAAMMAAGGLDLIAPGAGQAAQTGMKLANRAIQYGSQLAGIGVSGLMETFLPTGGSELASGGWLPRIIGGIAGSKPALPNTAGGKAGNGQAPPPLDPGQVQQQGMSAPAGQGPNITINNNNASPDQNGAAVAYHAQQAQTPPGNPF